MGNTGRLSRQDRALLVAGLILLGGGRAAAATCPDPAAIRPRLGAIPFTQVRTIQGLPRALRSEGIARIEPARVTWTVLRPFATETVITPRGITQSIGGQAARPAAGAALDPLMRSSGLFELLTGDFKALSRFYAIHTERTDGGWRASLKPRDGGMARFISGIEIAGCTEPGNVEIKQANGDSMVITWQPRKP